MNRRQRARLRDCAVNILRISKSLRTGISNRVPRAVPPRCAQRTMGWNRFFLEQSNAAGTRMRFAWVRSIPADVNGMRGGGFSGGRAMPVVGHDVEELIFEEEMMTSLWP